MKVTFIILRYIESTNTAKYIRHIYIKNKMSDNFGEITLYLYVHMCVCWWRKVEILPWIVNGFSVASVTFELQSQTHLKPYDLHVSRITASVTLERWELTIGDAKSIIAKCVGHWNNRCGSCVRDALFFSFMPLLCPIFHGACHVTSFINKCLNERDAHCCRTFIARMAPFALHIYPASTCLPQPHRKREM